MTINKVSRIRCEMGDVQEHVAHIIAREERATVLRTGYSVRIDTPRRRYFFADAGTSPRCFVAGARIRRDCEQDGTVTHVDRRAIHFNRIPVEAAMPRTCWCVDIKAAYPTTLKVQGWISPETYDVAMKLPKADRLKAVGMLATTKYLEQYEGGTLTLKTRQDDPLRPYFFAACAIVGDHMEAIAGDYGRAFAWYWVDGIFLTGDPSRAVDYLGAMGYASTVEKVEAVHWSPSRRFLFYSKGGGKTYLCVPRAVEYDADEVGRMIDNARTL